MNHIFYISSFFLTSFPLQNLVLKVFKPQFLGTWSFLVDFTLISVNSTTIKGLPSNNNCGQIYIILVVLFFFHAHQHINAKPFNVNILERKKHGRISDGYFLVSFSTDDYGFPFWACPSFPQYPSFFLFLTS